MRFIFVILAFYSTASAACPNFYGKWKSSANQTLEYTQKLPGVEPDVLFNLEQTAGTTSIEISKNSITFSAPNTSVTFHGKQYNLPARSAAATYKLLECTKEVAVIKYYYHGQKYVTRLHFPSKDTLWFYICLDLSKIYSHTREYYVRIKAE